MPENKSPELQYAADAGKQADKGKPEKPKAKEKEASLPPLPVLAEFTVTVCTILLVILFFTIVGVLLFTGANLTAFIVRTSVSLLVIGGLLVLIARQIIQGMIKAGMMSENQNSGQKSKAK